jgi:hypothetical protein
MALVIGGILSLLAIAVAVYPFLRHRFSGDSDAPLPDESGNPTGVDAARAEDELSEIYDAINTLRLERELGNIPDGLYREQLNGYRLRAAQALRNRELNEAGGEGWAIEEEIKVARSGLYGTGLYGSGGAGLPGTNCGKSVVTDADECTECGVPAGGSGSGAASPTDVEGKDQ